MKKLFSITIAAGLALALTGCTGSGAALSTANTDKDKDGVMDISDQCPNTVAGTKVSKDGCKIYTSVLDLNERELCSIEKNGVETVLATAKKYNAVAKKHGVEFRRQGVNNSSAITAVEEALKTGKKTVNPMTNKKKASKKTFTVEYATQRACKFAISALVLEAEGKTNWREALPGGEYKY
ncbi:MAG: hypothetical protein U9R16_04650 [Campylobacterota bacterium]|nr:hypothetical protein [Campylobacterota bacterium]